MKWLNKKDLDDINSIKMVEEAFGVKFPSDYINIILAYNAAMPDPNTIDTLRKTGKAFGELLSFNLDADENIMILYKELKNKIPEKVFPITMDAGGNFLCYDFRDDDVQPKVVRWDHEQKFVLEKQELIVEDHERESDYYHLDFVADSFTATLAKLYGEDGEQSDSWSRFHDSEKLKKFSGEDLIQVNRIRALQGLPPIEE